MRLRTTAVFALFLLLITALPAGAAVEAPDAAFLATLSGENEVPSVETDATGVASFRYDEDAGTLTYRVVARNIADVTQAHIHLGPAGRNGPVVAFLFGFADLPVDPDGTLATGTITEDDLVDVAGFDGRLSTLVRAMRNERAYVNVHTVEHPPGEIRGQTELLPDDDAFDDDDGNFHEASINLLAAAGITLGTDDGDFEPRAGLSRPQMAALLDRAFNLPATDDDFFDDDEDMELEDSINRVAAAGITLGCTEDGTRFCVRDDVTRGQMASFIARALSIADDVTLSDFFRDDNRSVHQANINRLALEGVTEGVDAGMFAPLVTITRDQIATFIARAMRWVPTTKADLFDLTVLHNNDGESELLADGEVGGVARFKTLVDQAKTTADATTDGEILVSSGDNFLAGPELTASVEDGIFYDVIALESFGYDAIELGNHDFDFGPDFLADFIAAYDDTPQYLAANLDFAGTPLEPLANDGTIAPSTVVTVDGRDVGIVGAVTEDLPSISQPQGVDVNPVQPAVQAEINRFTAAGVDIVVVVSHLQDIDEEIALGTQLDGVDLMIAGGGDELLANADDELLEGDEPEGAYPQLTTNADGHPVPVVTSSGSYEYLGRLISGFDDDGVLQVVRGLSGPLANIGFEQNETLLEQVEEPVADFLEDLAADVIAQSEVPLNGVRNDVRTQETNLGNLLTDAILVRSQEEATAASVPVPVVAVTNGGGIRNDSVIPAGPVTALDTFDIAPFSNFLAVDTVTRDTFEALLENAVSEAPDPAGRFAQVAGFSFVYDPTSPPGGRVISATLDDGTEVITGGDVVDGDDIVVATTDFLAAGGDDYPFDGEFDRLASTYQQALQSYIEVELGGEITSTDYPVDGEDRITTP